MKKEITYFCDSSMPRIQNVLYLERSLFRTVDINKVDYLQNKKLQKLK